jgi:hypothetical protein
VVAASSSSKSSQVAEAEAAIAAGAAMQQLICHVAKQWVPEEKAGVSSGLLLVVGDV